MNWLLLLVLLSPLHSLAQTVIVEDFSAASIKTSGTAVLNLDQGRLQPRLQVMNYGPAANESQFVDIGDGSDGAFVESRYAEFSMGGDISGNVIRLDLTRYPVVKLTRFELASGWRLQPVGDVPLQIKSQGTVTINGEIICSGGDGGSVTAAAPTVAGTGGDGRCGGSDGGAGGAVATSGSPGSAVVSGPTFGVGGSYTSGANGAGGGGGGGYSSVILASNGVYAGGGVASPGGAGGGGGSGGASQAGAGGGAGGGVVTIMTGSDVNIGASGKIWARGGAGGSTTGLSSGAGGSGGGGSVLIFAAGNVNSADSTGDDPGEIDAQRTLLGTGGSGSHGGSGGSGRTWVTTLQPYAATADLIPDYENPFLPGDIRYFVGADTFESSVFNLQSTLPIWQSITISPTSANVTIQASASQDNFQTQSTDWTAITDLSTLNDHRYFKFRFSINNTDAQNPTVINSADLTYEKGTQKDFNFQSAGCGSTNKPQSPNPNSSHPIPPPPPPKRCQSLFGSALALTKGASRFLVAQSR